MAQSAGAFATSPYVPFLPSAKPAAVLAIRAEPMKPEVQTASSTGQVLPIVMFRGKAPAPLPKPAVVSMAPVAIGLPAEAPKSRRLSFVLRASPQERPKQLSRPVRSNVFGATPKNQLCKTFQKLWPMLCLGWIVAPRMSRLNRC
jgi:hypothetical protein